MLVATGQVPPQALPVRCLGIVKQQLLDVGVRMPETRTLLVDSFVLWEIKVNPHHGSRDYAYAAFP